jgi:hypothetical protein
MVGLACEQVEPSTLAVATASIRQRGYAWSATPRPLLRFVRLSIERAIRAVRQDCSVAKKQESPVRFWSSSAASVSRA